MTRTQVPNFDARSPEVQKAIQTAASPCHFTAGQIVYLEGESAEYIYLIEAGWVKAAQVTHLYHKPAMFFVNPAEVFGNLAMITNAAYPGTVVSLEDMDAWSISAKTMSDLVQYYPELLAAIINQLGDFLLHYINPVEDLPLQSVEAWLAHTLLQHVIWQDEELIVLRRDGTAFDKMLARHGTAWGVLGQALKTLEGENLIRLERQTITLLDPKGLVERARRY